MSLNLDWAAIRALNGSKRDGFEELCAQLARADCPAQSSFFRKGRPDSGVEAYVVLHDGTEWAWQSKYFHTLGESQWTQLDESVRTALGGHPKLTRFIACIPLDLPDGRSGRAKSARERWNDRVTTWSQWAAQKGMSVNFIWQGSHEMLTALARPEHGGLVNFFFGNRYLDDAWFLDRLTEAHRAAGPRYTPELNVRLTLAEQFQALGRTAEFFNRIRSLASGIREHVSSYVFSVAKAPDATLLTLIAAAQASCNHALDEFRLLSDNPTHPTPLERLHNALHEAVNTTHKVLVEHRRQREAAKAAQPEIANGPRPRQEDDASAYSLRHLVSSLEDALTLVNDFMNVVDTRLMILTGDAGTGKTHLLCDLARQRLDSGQPTVVLMGQRFLDISDPWTQALQQLDLPGWTAREFVAALEVVAQRAGRKLLFIVDAINEGAGTRLWPAQLAPFLERITGSPWISTVISVRSSYLDDLCPEDVVGQAVCLEHRGFEDMEFDATRAFFQHYEIDLPSTPMLAPEFGNPLYLKTLCQGLRAAGESRLPRGFHGVVSAFALYLNGINARVSRELDFDARTDLVAKALNSLARRMVATRQFWLGYPEAESIVNDLLPGRDYSRSLMSRLLNEGLLIEERGWYAAGETSASAVMIGYERLSDYLCVGVLLEDSLDLAAPESAFRPGGPLDFAALSKTWTRPGFHEALHTLVAERTGKELTELLPELARHHHTAPAFLNSIVWREPTAVTPRAVQFLLKLKESKRTEVVETLITLATIPGHPLNARFLDAELRKSCMADRDAWWSIGLHALWDERSAVDRLIQWSNRLWPHSDLDDESAELTATVIVWLLTSSNRYLRDHATKSLVRVVTWRPSLIAKLVASFAAVDDAYVAERVLAAAYGASMRSQDASGAERIANATYRTVFAAGRPRPHLLFREYARGIIKRAEHLLAASKPSPWRGIDPPYSSDWPAIPDQAALDEIVPGWSSGRARSDSWGQNRIRSSIMDDDFGRYVIGTNSGATNWLSVRLNEPPWMSLERRVEHAVSQLSAEELRGWEIFEQAAKRASFARFNVRMARLGGDDDIKDGIKAPGSPSEAILVKIQDTLLEMLGDDRRQTFSALMDEISGEAGRRHAPKFDLRLVQRYVLARVFDLGWTAKRFDQFDSKLTSSGRGEAKAERIGKKYQWIAYHEMLAFMADHYQHASGPGSKEIGAAYRGSWQDNFRDIDPSNVMQALADSDDEHTDPTVFWVPATVSNWSVGTGAKVWAQATADVPLPGDLLLSKDGPSQSEWVNLCMHIKWTMPRPAYEHSYKDGRREIWIDIEGALVKRSDVATLKSRAVAKRIEQGGMHNSDNYEIFLGEIGWSEASRHYLDPYYGHIGWARDAENEGVSAIPASQGYLRERGSIDCSLASESIKLRAPSEAMLPLLGADWSGISATYVNKANTVVAFDPSVNVRGPSAFLVRKETLLEILQAHDLVVCWVLHGEKMDARGAPNYSPKARRSFHGIFLWSGSDVEGRYSFDKVELEDGDD
jgi:hypothetical protein